MAYHFATRSLPFKYHKQRVAHDLIAAGVTPYGMIKSSSRYMPRIINENEHIQAVIYGVYNSNLVMIVATDQRIIYLDKKPMAVHEDEISYSVVSGVQLDVHIFFATVTLHTAIDNYRIRFVNLKCADKFSQYIEERIVEAKTEKRAEPQPIAETKPPTPPESGMLKKFERDFLYWLNPSDDDEK